LVVHLTSGAQPPAVTAAGTRRIERLVERARNCGVRLAFENMRASAHVCHVLDAFDCETVGLCYDSGHEYLWTPGVDHLAGYARRVAAVHLHDNDGTADAHLPPFRGSIDWRRTAARLAASAYGGAVTLEAEMPFGSSRDEVDAFLRQAYAHGRKLAGWLEQAAKGAL
ncbi:MAG: TIM barrel protein, partial [Eubacteriales bacterium]|nr:TIM barrel protein [Eubacteriales bacterium]